MANSIVAGNTGSPGADIDGTATDDGYNLIGDGSASTGFTNGSNGTQVGTTAAPVIPQLAALDFYGGTTQTMIPLPGIPPAAGSPAICAGSATLIPSGVTADQRGFSNTNSTYNPGTACVDVGAVQTNYQSIQFLNIPFGGVYAAAAGAVPIPAPIISVTENGQNLAAVPVTLTDTGSSGSTVSGLGPANTYPGVGATFTNLEDPAAENHHALGHAQHLRLVFHYYGHHRRLRCLRAGRAACGERAGHGHGWHSVPGYRHGRGRQWQHRAQLHRHGAIHQHGHGQREYRCRRITHLCPRTMAYTPLPTA